jgi:hypothetical protein
VRFDGIFISVVTACVTLILISAAANAAPLGIYDSTNPLAQDQWGLDMATAADSTVVYDASTGAFTVSGVVLQLKDERMVDTHHAIVAGVLSISAVIDNSGVLQSGSVTVSGTIPTLGFSSGTLLTGDLWAFGHDDASYPLEFWFSITGGDAAGIYGSQFGTPGGIVIFDSGFSGSFATDFSSIAAAVHVIPEPSATLLFFVGLLAVSHPLRAKRSRQLVHHGTR